MGFMDSLFAAVANRSGNSNVAALGNALQRKPSGGNSNTPQSNANTGGSWANLISQIAQRSQGAPNIPSLRQQQYEAPASYQTPTTQSAAPAKQEQKQTTKEEKQERKTFNDALANALGGMMLGGAGVPVNNLLAPDTAEAQEKPEDEKQKEEVAPNVTVEGSNDANAKREQAKQAIANPEQPMNIELPKDSDATIKTAQNILQNPGIAYGSDYMYPTIEEMPKANLGPRAWSAMKDAEANPETTKVAQDQARYYADTLGVPYYDPLLYATQEYGYSRPGEPLPFNVDEYNSALNEARKTEGTQSESNDGDEKEAEKSAETSAKTNTAGNQSTDDSQLYYGLTRDQINQMYEDAIYNAAMADENYRKLFDEAGYGDYGSYAAYGSLGDTLDYDSRREITRDIFGLDDTQPDLEIQGLKDIYYENGVINDKMTPDEMLDAILEAHWGADNIINPYQWMTDEAYQAANPFNGSSAASGYTDYWQQSEMLPNDVFANLSGDWGQLDDTDFATLVAAGNILNQINNGWKPSDADLEAMSQLFQNAGDLASFAYLPDDGSESEYKGREWNANRYANAYSMPQLLQAVAAANDKDDYSGLNPYVDSNMALGDRYMTDTIAKAIEDSTGKKVGRKDR